MLALNELSLEGFGDVPSFVSALRGAREIQAIFARDHRLPTCVARDRVWDRSIDTGQTIREIVGGLPRDARQLVHTWLSTLGPFWSSPENPKRHDKDALQAHVSDVFYWLEEDVVTDSTVAEVAARQAGGEAVSLLSLRTPRFEVDPLRVLRGEQREEAIDVRNLWDAGRTKEIASWLWEERRKRINSWDAMARHVRERLTRVAFVDDAFGALTNQPFQAPSADRIVELCLILDEFARETREDGRTDRAQELYQIHFTGKNAAFSDSSDNEVNHYGDALSFDVPTSPTRTLCRWHGKERHLVLRMHFTWPVRADETVWVAYVGPKLTKQ